MDQSRSQRVVQVCKICKTRKKRCDKSLPKCGYCKVRNLTCQYDGSSVTATKRVAEPKTQQRHQSSPSETAGADSWTIGDVETGPATFTAPVYELPNTLGVLKPGESLWMQARQIMTSHNLTLEEVANRLFDGIHVWLPIISPKSFRRTVSNFRHTIPPQDFSVLVLAVCLVTLRPPSHDLRNSAADLTSIYSIAKSAFAQVQTVQRASVQIIQASILIATFEYACAQPLAAYITIGLSSRLSHTVGIDQCSTSSRELFVDNKTLEAGSTWWGVLILERLILAEIDDRARYSMTNFTTDDMYLPVRLDYDQLQNVDLACPLNFDPSAMQSNRIDGFGRQAQAIHLLDQALSAFRDSTNADARIWILYSLDVQLQELLSVVMSEYEGPGSHCGPNAIVLRTLYLLHQGILLPANTCTADETAYGLRVLRSQSALDTTTKMIAQVASDHVHKIKNIDRLPICAAYNFQICIQYLEARRKFCDGDSLAALGPLETLVGIFRERWPMFEISATI